MTTRKPPTPTELVTNVSNCTFTNNMTPSGEYVEAVMALARAAEANAHAIAHAAEALQMKSTVQAPMILVTNKGD